MQVAILGRNIQPPWNEAVKNMGFELACQLVTYGHKVHLLTTRGCKEAADHGVIVHKVPLNGFWREAVKTLLRLEADGDLDLIHLHNLIIHRSFAPFLGVLRRRSHLPILAYCCQLPGISFSNWVRVLRKDPWEALTTKLGMLVPSITVQWTLNIIDQIVASSGFVQRELSVSKPRRPVEIIHPFFNSDRFRLSKRMMRPGSDGHKVLYLGSHKVLRGEDDFLLMLGLLRRDYPALEGVAVTPDPIPRRIRRLVKTLNLEHSVKFLSRNVELDIPSLIRASDLYVFTGLSPIGSIDPPLSVVESLILGTPVLSYDTGGIGEILDSSNLVKYRDHVSLARNARRFLNGGENVNPRSELLSEFSTQGATKRFKEVYDKLA